MAIFVTIRVDIIDNKVSIITSKETFPQNLSGEFTILLETFCVDVDEVSYKSKWTPIIKCGSQ